MSESIAIATSWQKFQDFYFFNEKIGLSLDLSRMGMTPEFLEKMSEAGDKAIEDMWALEKGGIANPDENRMVGHYWLRAPELAPTPELRKEIEDALASVKAFAAKVHAAEIKPPTRPSFKRVLSVGIGGSALGPQFVSQALGGGDDKMTFSFLDNSDPDGFDRIFQALGEELAETLTVVISKSGGTPETLNGMREAENAYKTRGLDFAKHAVAVTGDGSVLDKEAQTWLARFPMWDWIGGRTSVMSTVGLVGAALQGIDVDAFLAGAREMDVWTRNEQWRTNPALGLALSWYFAGSGKGLKDMVILPYKDRLALFSRYLQQLVMESLGKEKNLKGEVVHQGIAVYGNKGSTDQHAYVQQLRDGLNNFYATFVVVLKEREGEGIKVQGDSTSGDFLSGFWQGTREALTQNGRQNIALTIPEVNAFTVGALIALYERAVSFYGSLVGINAYHQPGVEAGKKAAKVILDLQTRVVDFLKQEGKSYTAEEIANKLNNASLAESVFHICQHLAANGKAGISARGEGVTASFGVAGN